MIKVVIDTGVVVSAAFRDRTPEDVVLFVAGEDEFEWIVSPDILDEYTEVLARKKFNLPIETLNQWQGVFDEFCTVVNAEEIIDFPRDRKDAKFLECALSVDADFLITGDRDFGDAERLIETTIISISQFHKLVIETWNR